VTSPKRMPLDPYTTGSLPAVSRRVWAIARRPHSGVNRWREVRRVLRIEWHDALRRLRLR
jgi:hypothetical protein